MSGRKVLCSHGRRDCPVCSTGAYRPTDQYGGLAMPTEPRAAPLIGRPPRGSLVHLQHDHDIRRSLCGDGVSGADSWELDTLCATCWAEATRTALEDVAERVRKMLATNTRPSDVVARSLLSGLLVHIEALLSTDRETK